MSEERIADARISIFLPSKNGKKTIKIRMFLAAQFKTAWSPNIRDQFFPPVPMRKDMADEYWTMQQFRVKVGESWIMGKGRYSFYTLSEVLKFVEEAFQ